MDMKNFEKKIGLLKEELLTVGKSHAENYILSEMKRIGIDKLPYSYSSLQRFIDSKTMRIHYSKHYKGYVKKLNKALSEKDYGNLELEEIIKSINRFNKTIRNNAGGAFNHALFWKMLSPNPQKPNGEILEKIKKDFGSFQKFKSEFEESAKSTFGSGWVWLILTKGNKLRITTTPNQDNPLMNIIDNGGYPLLGLDLWEHAYYLKYQNKRDEYIHNFWECVNWEFVNNLLNKKINSKINESINKKLILNEGKSEKCTKEKTEAYRFIFNVNPEIKNIFKNSINLILKGVFPKNYYNKDEYSAGEMSGIYDLEKEGRSVINKLNTNYSCFCILITDVNQVLKKDNKKEIDIIGLPPKEQIEETKRFISYLNNYKFRIFSKESSTFKNIINILSQTDLWGQKREDKTIEKLKQKFGNENVVAIGKLGSKEDMIGGIDCKIKIDNKEYTAQIKPYSETNKVDNMIQILGTANVKKYYTDWLIFTNYSKEILVFNNKNTKIINGNYVFNNDDLIFNIK